MNKRDDILGLSADEYAGAYADTIIENYCCIMEIFFWYTNFILKHCLFLFFSEILQYLLDSITFL